MVVCKFFQQGNCRYGQNCRFDHIYGTKFSYHAPQPQPQPSQVVPSGVTDEQLVNQVQSDVQAALNGGQWVLSSYSPFKEKPNFPGISDLSMEEARLFIYEAKATNNIDQAVAYMNNLFQEARHKYEQLLQPTPAIMNVLRSLYKGEIVMSPFSSNTPSSNYGTDTSATSLFRSAVTSNSIFGQANPNTSVFGQNPTNTNTSIFGQNSGLSTNAASVFDQKPNFGAADVAAKSIFAQASHNMFGQNQMNNTGFMANQPLNNVFGPSQPSNVFDNAPTDSGAKSIFAQASQSVFNSNQPQGNPANIFASASQSVFASSPFSQQQNAPQLANQAQMSTPFSNAAQSIFQIADQQNANDYTVYSDMKDLSPIDIECFSADEFKLGFIPEIPPPHSLCF